MKFFVLCALLSLSSYVAATNHTRCFNHFLNKDGCVFSSASTKTACKVLKHVSQPAPRVVYKQHKVKRNTHHLERRYDTTHPSQFISSPADKSDGICGFYNSTTELGVCLWSGPEQKSPSIYTAGWINGLKTSNCNKRVYVQRQGQPKTTVFAKVVDGCGFNAVEDTVGCFQIGLTEALYYALKPTEAELKSGSISSITWDFDNLKNTSPQQAPV